MISLMPVFEKTGVPPHDGDDSRYKASRLVWGVIPLMPVFEKRASHYMAGMILVIRRPALCGG